MRFSLSVKTSVRSGMTLVEIATVIAIISTLSTLSFYAFSSAKKFADGIATKANAAKSQALANMGKAGAALASVGAAPAPRPTYVPGEYFVYFTPAVMNPASEAARLSSLVGGQQGDIFTVGVYGFLLTVKSQDLSRLAIDPGVKQIVPVPFIYACAVPNNIKRVYSNGMNPGQDTAGSTTFYGVPTAHYRQYRNTTNTTGQPLITGRLPVSGSTGATIAVGIMDTGIDKTHPDLFVVSEFDFTNNNNPRDNDGHGTHIAGVVGAIDRSSGAGVVGVYPGAPLVNMKVMNSPGGSQGGQSLGFGSAANVYRALNYIIANPKAVRVCLMAFQASGGVDITMDPLVNAASKAGVLMIAPSGNRTYSSFTDSYSASAPVSPASATESVVVGALLDEDGLPGGLASATDDVVAPYSNTTNVNFLAPGGFPSPYFQETITPTVSTIFNIHTTNSSIRSTIPLAGQIANGLANPYSTTINGSSFTGNDAFGTSFAAAHVAGMFAYVLDPQTTIGFVVGNAIPTFRFGVVNRTTAVTNLTNLTHNTTRFQMVNPLTNSAWLVTGTAPKVVTPYLKVLNNDRVFNSYGGFGVIGTRTVLNFYQNPSVAPSFLAPFPG